MDARYARAGAIGLAATRGGLSTYQGLGVDLGPLPYGAQPMLVDWQIMPFESVVNGAGNAPWRRLEYIRQSPPPDPLTAIAYEIYLKSLMHVASTRWPRRRSGVPEIAYPEYAGWVSGWPVQDEGAEIAAIKARIQSTGKYPKAVSPDPVGIEVTEPPDIPTKAIIFRMTAGGDPPNGGRPVPWWEWEGPMPPTDAQLEQKRASFIAAHLAIATYANTYGQAALYETPGGQALLDAAKDVQDTPATDFPDTFLPPPNGDLDPTTVTTTTGLPLPPVMVDGSGGTVPPPWTEGPGPGPVVPLPGGDVSPGAPGGGPPPVFVPPTGGGDVVGAPVPGPLPTPGGGSGGVVALALAGLVAFTLFRKKR